MIKGLGAFCLIKNEKIFIKAHLKSWLPHLEQMVFYDGNSTDGTLEIIKEAQKGEFGNKIKLYENKDCKDLTADYEKLSNECMWCLDTDFAVFLHPDMFLDNREVLKEMPKDGIAGTINIRSFAGEPDGQIYEIKGRGDKWKNIYRLRNPNLGAHYFGSYGAANEDTYFSKITGNSHEHFGQSFFNYPYKIFDSGLNVLHYSDVRTRERRLDRMIKCLVNQGYTPEAAKLAAPRHPRVSFEDDCGFTFTWLVEPPVILNPKEYWDPRQ